MLRGGRADLAVQAFLVWSELQHVAKHRDPAAARSNRCLRQEFERGTDADRRGVVRIVDERRTARGLEDRHAVRRAAACGQRRRDLIERQVEAVRHRGGGERVRHQVPARGAAVHVALAPRRGEQELGPVNATAGHVGGAHVGFSPETKGADLRTRDGTHGGDARIVGVQDGQAIGGQRGGQLRLGLCDALDASCAFEVRGMHGQHHSDFGACDLREAGDLTDGVHAHLQHGHLVGGFQVEEGHWQT